MRGRKGGEGEQAHFTLIDVMNTAGVPWDKDKDTVWGEGEGRVCVVLVVVVGLCQTNR